MSGHLTTDRMHDLLDGLLAPAAEAEARAHLGECPTCQRGFDELAGVVADIRGLPRSATPPDGLWTGIEARISGADVIALPARRRTFVFSAPQLAAAALLVSLLSAGTVWTMLSQGSATSPEAVVFETNPRLVGAAARVASIGDEEFEATIRELETMVEEGRDLLDPETLEALEGALETIDAALADVREALDSDPASTILKRMLVRHQTTKVRVLRQVADVLESRS